MLEEDIELVLKVYDSYVELEQQLSNSPAFEIMEFCFIDSLQRKAIFAGFGLLIFLLVLTAPLTHVLQASYVGFGPAASLLNM